MKIATLIVDIPFDPKALRGLSYDLLYDATRSIIGEYIIGEGLIAAILDVEPQGEAFRAPTDCRIYIRLKAKVVLLDIAPGDVIIGTVKKIEGRYVEISVGRFISGTAHVSHLGPTDRYRYEARPNEGIVIRRDKETGEAEYYLRALSPVRAKIAGGIGRTIGTVRFSMKGERLGPLEILKRKREQSLREG